MAFKIFIFVFNLIIPIVMLFFGVKFRKHSPKNINEFYGYRTTMSTKNEQTWKFAHKYCSRLWIKLGLIILIISIIFSLIAFTSSNKVQMVIVLTLVITQTFILSISIIPIEK